MKVLVCGGRDYNDRIKLFEILDKLHVSRHVAHVITGAARGADTHALEWALFNEIPFTGYPARWNTHGKAAGPIRNQQMLEESKPDLVVAFPGGRGTADMVKRAKAGGYKVYQVAEES